MRLETNRLVIESVSDSGPAELLLPVFNSNPEYVANAEQDPGKVNYSIEDVEHYLAEESSREGSRCLAIWERASGQLIGTACLLVPHPKESLPWIGLLLVHSDYQSQGFGAEARASIEGALASVNAG